MIGPVFEHLAEVGDEIRAAPHLLLGLDFDGTLAPIVPHAKDAAVPRETVSLLEGLTARDDLTVAIVSGRALADLESRVPLDHTILAGNHGLEIRGRGLDFRHAEAEKSRFAIHQVCEQLSRRLLSIPGAWVEDKGLTASVHFRNSREQGKDDVAAIVYAAIEADHQNVVVRNGNQILEIRPRAEWNKGSAVRWILERLPHSGAAVCYLGDDETDEDVFSIVKGVTIRVGQPAPTAARYTLRDTRDVAGFLGWLLTERRSAEPAREDFEQPSASR